MTRENLNLHNITDHLPDGNQAKTHQFHASDFLTAEERHKIHENNRKSKKNRKFSPVDAYIAEIIARFGWETYQAWNRGEIAQTTMGRYLEAERARDVAKTLGLESIIIASLQGAQQPMKRGAKRPIEVAHKILERQEKQAKGED